MRPVFDDGMMLYDTLMATNERTMETILSQHLAIGQHCVELLRPQGEVNSQANTSHHFQKVRSLAKQSKRKIGK